jgi:hypothetical protein
MFNRLLPALVAMGGRSPGRSNAFGCSQTRRQNVCEVRARSSALRGSPVGARSTAAGAPPLMGEVARAGGLVRATAVSAQAVFDEPSNTRCSRRAAHHRRRYERPTGLRQPSAGAILAVPSLGRPGAPLAAEREAVRRTRAIANERNEQGLRSEEAVINNGRVSRALGVRYAHGGGQQRPPRYRI